MAEKFEKLCEIIEKMEHAMAEASGDLKSLDAKEAGEVADIIKDLYMAKYYASIADAMEDAEYGEDYDEMGTMGYRGRSATTGRFVHRSGSGRMAGYTPRMPYPYYPDDYADRVYGYDGGGTAGATGNGYRSAGRYGRMNSGGNNPRDAYRSARSGYNATHNPEHKTEMKAAVTEAVDGMEEIMLDAWGEMEPGEKQQYKIKLQNLINSMK